MKFKTNYSSIFVHFIFLSFFLQSLSINIGFYLKPYMIISLFLILKILTKTKYNKLIFFEMFFLSFYFFYCFTILFSSNWAFSIRMIMGIFIFLFTYFIYRDYFYDFFDEEILANVGIIFSLLSFSLYLLGLYHSNLTSIQNPKIFGLFYDRGMFRMAGLVNNPDYFNIFNIIFIFYSYKNLKENKNIFLFFISALNTLLTFSISAFFSIITALFFDFCFFNSTIRKIKKIMILILFILTMYFILYFLVPDNIIVKIINIRLDHLNTGSGRYLMWENILKVIYNNFIFGIGINNTAIYTRSTFNIINAHNTYLEVLSDSGVFIFSIFVFFILGILFSTYRLAKIDSSKTYLLLSLICIFTNIFFVSATIHEGFLFVVLTAITGILRQRNIEGTHNG